MRQKVQSTPETTGSTSVQTSPREVIVRMPVKPGETVWQAQERIKKRSDPTQQSTRTLAPAPGAKPNGIATFYRDSSGKPTGDIAMYNDPNGSGEVLTNVIEYDPNSRGNSGTISSDFNNDGIIDQRIRFCKELFG